MSEMSDASSTLTAQGFQEAGGVEHWRVLATGAGAWFEAPTHSAGAQLLTRVIELAEQSGRPKPDIDLRSTGVQVRIHPPGGAFSTQDVELARAISTAAADLGLQPDTTVGQDVQLTFDSLDPESLKPFWSTVLGYEATDEDLLDPLRRHPPIWLQDQDAPRPLRNRIHLDVVTPQPRAAAALSAVREQGASTVADHGYYATVADPEGNEVDMLPLPEGADRWGDESTDDFRVVFAAMAVYPTTSGQQVADLASAVAAAADQAGLPLGIDVRDGLVIVDTGKDTWESADGYEPLAVEVQRAARSLGLTADVAAPRFVQVGIDAVDIPALRTFWRAALGYVADPREGVTDIVDPRRLNTVLFFQPMDADDQARRAQRNRIHLDVFVADDQLKARVAAAVAAGGRIVNDSQAPHCVTVADPEGNEVDFAVSVGREERGRAAGAN